MSISGSSAPRRITRPSLIATSRSSPATAKPVTKPSTSATSSQVTPRNSVSVVEEVSEGPDGTVVDGSDDVVVDSGVVVDVDVSGSAVAPQADTTTTNPSNIIRRIPSPYGRIGHIRGAPTHPTRPWVGSA